MPSKLLVGWQVTGNDLHGNRVTETYRHRDDALEAFDTLASGTFWEVEIGGKRTILYRKRTPRPASIFALHIR